MIQPQLVRDIAPELAAASDERVSLFIGFAESMVNSNVWGSKTDQGVAVLTAHLLTMSNRGGNGGAVVSEKVGDLSVNYSAPKNGDDDLESTAYGKWFLRLRRSLPITPITL
jgi:hypothetical protein